MTGDEIRGAQFREARRGYRPADVDAFLDRLAEAADRGEDLTGLVREASFREGKRAYDTAEVDAFLARATASTN
jgi:DivIVA domain-containing protein